MKQTEEILNDVLHIILSDRTPGQIKLELQNIICNEELEADAKEQLVAYIRYIDGNNDSDLDMLRTYIQVFRRNSLII